MEQMWFAGGNKVRQQVGRTWHFLDRAEKRRPGGSEICQSKSAKRYKEFKVGTDNDGIQKKADVV